MANSEILQEKMDTVCNKKRIRQRKSNLYENIRKQMEFYFSLPNLQKDRFLKKLVLSDPKGLVDVDIFMKFNKIRELTNDISCILKALKESESLTVDDDGKRIGRKVKYEEPQDTDQRTVYAEFLPKDVTIDWLTKHFSQAGKVVHVSLPKYKSTGDIKGFAFVEFETVDDANSAATLLNSPSNKVATSKPGIFAKTFKSGKHMKKPPIKGDNESMEVEGEPVKDKKHELTEDVSESLEVQVAPEKSAKKKKRKRNESGTSLTVGQEAEGSCEMERSAEKVRKRKVSEDVEDESVPPTKVNKLEHEGDDMENPLEMSGSSHDRDSMTAKKKKTKRDKSNKSRGGAEAGEDANVLNQSMESECTEGCQKTAKDKKKLNKKNKKEPVQTSGMRVISKQEWLEYRQAYYLKHKENMSELKKKIKDVKVKNAPKEHETTNDVKETAKEDGLTFVPDVIIKVSLANPISKKFLKDQMSESGKVAFLEMNEGELTAFARCSDAESAAEILKTSVQECSYALLKGDEEKAYWDKVFNDREKRLSTKNKKKVRGRDKLLSKADKVMKTVKATCIVYDD